MAPTPAEALAAAHAAANAEIIDIPVVSSKSSNGVKKTAINDDSAFPALGTAPSSSSSSTSWGPNMAKPAASKTGSSSSGKSNGSIPMRSTSAQEAFSIDFDDQLNVTKAEFAVILNKLRKSTGCNIECTSSQRTRKRTFLITGNQDLLIQARKDIVRAVTKPIKTTFTIPSSTRYFVIGKGGKNLKPIIENNGVKIDISREENADPEDLFGGSVNVTIEGDISSVDNAKSQILAIVDENTKSLTTKFSIDSTVIPFIEKAALPIVSSEVAIYVNSNGFVSITGPREELIEAKEKIVKLAEYLVSNVITIEETVPKKFHKFINADEIFEKLNVKVEVPLDDEDSKQIKFIGESSKIPNAIKLAKEASTKHSIESLNIARAHNNNIDHAKNLGIYFKKTNVLKEVEAIYEGVTISLPSYDALISTTTKEVIIDFIFDKQNESNFKKAKKSVVDLVNQLAPTHFKIIGDIDSFFGNEISKAIGEVENVLVIPFAILKTKKISGKILLVYINSEDDDFGPTIEEISELFAKIDQSLDGLRELGKNVVSETIEIPKNEQTHISGPKGATLRSLKSSINNSIDILFETPSENQVTVHGLKDDVDSISKEIATVIQDAKDYAVASKYSTSFEVPSSVLPRLIGKNGSYLNTIRDEFGININVDKNEEKLSNTSITIIGIKRNAEEAKVKIINLGKKWADETTQILKVPQQYQRRLIGPKGAYANRLQDKYSVRINFSHDDDVKKDEVSVRGPSKGVKKAIDELKELLSYEIENGHKSVIDVPSSAVSRIIGKNGTNLKALRDEFGVEIDVNDKEELGSQVEITGSKNSLKEVEKKIKEIVHEVETTITLSLEVEPKYYGLIFGPNGSTLRAIFTKAKAAEDNSSRYRLLSIPEKGSESHVITSTGDKKVVESIINQVKELVELEKSSINETLTVPQEKHRLLIGPMGSIRRQIEADYNVTLMIPPMSQKNDDIKIKGLLDNVNKAKEYVLTLVADNWSESLDIPSNYHAGLSQKGATFKKLKSSYNIKVEHGQLNREANKLSNSIISIPESIKEINDDSKFNFITVKKTSNDDSKLIPWRLVGAPDNAAKAKKYLEDLLEVVKTYDTYGYLYIPNRSIFSKIIGPRGSTVEKIRKNSGVNITIPQVHENNNDIIVLEGTIDGINKAKDEILKIIK